MIANLSTSNCRKIYECKNVESWSLYEVEGGRLKMKPSYSIYRKMNENTNRMEFQWNIQSYSFL